MSPIEAAPLRMFCVQMRPQGDGPWPPLMRIPAHKVCKDGKTLRFKVDGDVIGEVTGIVDAWWTEDIPST